jgi:hypothetical protein
MKIFNNKITHKIKIKLCNLKKKEDKLKTKKTRKIRKR